MIASRVLAAACALAGMTACSSSSLAPGPGKDASAGDAAPADGATTDDGGGIVQIPPDDAGDGVDSGLGIGVVDVPDVPCVPRGGPTAVLFGATTAITLDSLHAVGGRRVARGTRGEGFVTFDANGGNPTAPKPLQAFDNRVGVTQTGIYVAGTSQGVDESVVAAQFDPGGAPVGAQMTLAGEPTIGLNIGGASDRVLVAWGASGAVHARGIDAQGPAGAAPYDLAITGLTRGLTSSIIDDGLAPKRFAIAFSGDNGGMFQTVFARGTTTERSGDPFVLFKGPRDRTVVQLAKTPLGYVLLVSVAGPDPFAALVPLDPTGHVHGPARRLLGSQWGLGIAAQGSEVGVVAMGTRVADGGTVPAFMFRPFDDTPSPLGPWVCLDGAAAGPDDSASIDTDGTGYAAVYTAPDGSAVFTRFDHLGTGGP